MALPKPQMVVDPVLAALDNAPLGPAETEEERAAVLAAMGEADAASGVPQEELLRKLAAARR